MRGAKKIKIRRQVGRCESRNKSECRGDALGVAVKGKCGACDGAVATASLGIVSVSWKEANAMMRGGELEVEVWNVGCGHRGGRARALDRENSEAKCERRK